MVALVSRRRSPLIFRNESSRSPGAVENCFAGFAAAKHDFRARHREFEALAAHGLDENAELQLAAAGDFHGILFVGFGNAQRDIAFANLPPNLKSQAELYGVLELIGAQ